MEQWDAMGQDLGRRMDAHACFQEEYALLGGKWRYLALSADEDAPEGWQEPDFDDRKWGRAVIPGKDTGAGLYRRSFILSRDQGSRRIIFRFAGMQGLTGLWINGAFIGSADDPAGDVEFDITDVVRREKNRVCIRTSGPVRREPGLYTQPSRCITDIQSRLRRMAQGENALAVQVKARNAEGFTARIALMEEDKVLRYGEAAVEDGVANALLDCAGLTLWSPEAPALYRIAVILWDGVAIHHTRELTVGLREARMENGILTVNGKVERVFGVIYDPASLSADAMEGELKLLREHNFNAIAVNGPAPEELLRLCDRIGLYVLEKTGISRETCSEDRVKALTAGLFAARSAHPASLGWDLEPAGERIVKLGPELTISSEGVWDRSVSVLGSYFEAWQGDHLIPGYCDEEGVLRPAIREAQALLAPVVCRFSEGVLTVENRNRFLSTGAYDAQLVLTRDGEVSLTRPIALDIAPGEAGTMNVETRYDIYKAGLYHLSAEFRRKADGAVVARDQWEVGNLRHIYDENPGGTIRDEAGRIHLRAQDSSYVIDRADGCPEQITVDGLELLQSPMQSLFSRPMAGLRIPDEWDRFTARWKKIKPAVLEVDQMTRTVTASFRLGSGLMQTYRLFADGSLSMELRLRTGKTAPDRMGWQCRLKPGVDRCSWFGLGPDGSDENHRAGRYYGIHTMHSGNPDLRDGVYFLTLTDAGGKGIRIRSEEGLRFSLDREGSVLTLLMPQSGELAPHTTYTFSLTICPIQ